MDSNEIFKQMIRTETFLKIAEQNNIPPEAYEGENASVENASVYPFIQALKDIARHYDINNAERTEMLIKGSLLKE